MDGDEVFDPGDVYWWKGAVFPNPTNGFKDDVRIFGYDPDPDPLIPDACSRGNGDHPGLLRTTLTWTGTISWTSICASGCRPSSI